MTKGEAREILQRKGAIRTVPNETGHEFGVMYTGGEYQTCHWWPTPHSELGSGEMTWWDANASGIESVLGWCEESIVPWEFWEEADNG